MDNNELLNRIDEAYNKAEQAGKENDTAKTVIEPKVTERTVIEPKVTERTVIEPKVTERTVIEPKVTERTVIEPEATERTVIEPKTQRTVIPPQPTHRTVVEPKMVQRTANEQQMSQRNMAEMQQVKPVEQKEKRSGKGKVARVVGKIAVLVASGVLFGLCAAVVFGVVNYYTSKAVTKVETTTVAVTPDDDIVSKVEADVLALIEEKISNGETDEEAVLSAVSSVNAETVVTDVTAVVDEVMPSVVSITNNYTSYTDFWGRQYAEEAESSGSGIIIGENDDELLIATNNHVIDAANTLSVKFIDNEIVEAHVKGADADMDIAVIAVKKDKLQTSTAKAISVATLGDSDELKVGEPAIAIGNALGYGQSVTTGVISALNRELEVGNGEYSQGFIQTDAAINPGNSGGALLNVKGEVIGINSNKIGGSTIEGMGYAIPISRALPIIDNLKTKKTKDAIAEENKGYLGISGRGVSSEMSEIYGFPQGVYIYEVYEGTGAAKAKLRKGDIITKFEGTTLDSMEKLQGLLAYYEAGDTVELTIERFEGEEYKATTITVELVEQSMLPSE